MKEEKGKGKDHAPEVSPEVAMGILNTFEQKKQQELLGKIQALLDEAGYGLVVNPATIGLVKKQP